jgi:hypothetical protein
MRRRTVTVLPAVPPGPNRWWATAAACAMLAGASALLLGCAHPEHASEVACGGQCGPPYLLDVMFTDGTSKTVVTRALKNCAQFSPVTSTKSVKVPPGRGRGWEGRVFSLKNMHDPGTVPLVACLERQTGVTSASWPE